MMYLRKIGHPIFPPKSLIINNPGGLFGVWVNLPLMANHSKPEAVIRLEKLEELRKLGIDPYPAIVPDHITIEEVLSKKEGGKFATVGRITSIRGHGKSSFIDLEDADHKLQLFVKEDEVGKKDYQLLKLLDHGDYLWAEGELFTTKSGQLTLKTNKALLLAKSLLPVPDGWHGLSDVETRYRQRTLDFKINDQAKKIIQFCSLSLVEPPPNRFQPDITFWMRTFI